MNLSLNDTLLDRIRKEDIATYSGMVQKLVSISFLLDTMIDELDNNTVDEFFAIATVICAKLVDKYSVYACDVKARVDGNENAELKALKYLDLFDKIIQDMGSKNNGIINPEEVLTRFRDMKVAISSNISNNDKKDMLPCDKDKNQVKLADDYEKYFA